jgi:glycosyltransferase involved in cell wall biosynthesis
VTRDPRLAVDFVSPLPPVRSGIADYSLDLLPHLAERLDVRVLGLPGQPVAPEVARRFAVVAAKEARPPEGWAACPRLPLYQMGNNRYHSGVEAMALERPGVLTLHDLVLHHLVSEETLGERDFEAYRARLAADHGWIGLAVAGPREWGAEVEAALFALPVHRRLIRRQRGVLVHNRWAAERIRREDPEVRVEVVPMGVPLPPPADREAGLAFRRRHGLPEDAVVLGSFGFQTPIKRTARVVEALARLADSGSGPGAVHLLVVGEGPTVGPGGEIETLARELGVAERVHETGFVPFEELSAAIAASDLAVNLRYPTAGETSASLLRVLAVGRPAIVSDYAQFAELPDEAVIKAPLGDDEVPALAARLAELLPAPRSSRHSVPQPVETRLAAMGRAAREHVRRHHDPAGAARAVADGCREWAGAPTPGDRPATPPPPTSRVWEELPGSIEVAPAAGAAAGAPWPPGERRRLAVTLTNSGPARWLAAHRGAGGLALQVQLLTPAGDLLAGRPWLALLRDLAPGESWTAEIEVRRPPGPATLRLVPQVMGGFPLGDPFLDGEALTWEERWEDPWP